MSYVVGTTSPSEPEGETYSAVLVAANNDVTQVNREAMNVSNDAKMWVYNADTFAYDTIALADLINFDADVNLYTKIYSGRNEGLQQIGRHQRQRPNDQSRQ